MQLAHALKAAGLDVFPCRVDKKPAIPNGTSWKDQAKLDVGAHDWPSPLVGIPIPPGTIVIDLDLYKGVTREAVDAALGVRLPWDAALIQRTQGGGEHYAFRCDWDTLHGSNLCRTKGFDIRAATRGYICTGVPLYTPYGFGAFRLGQPETLPVLPNEVRPVLERVKASPTTNTVPPDYETIVAALRWLDPGRARNEWIRVGLALRAWAGDDYAGGLALFQRWSSGELSESDPPANYVAEHIEPQWASFSPQGDTTVGTLFYDAIQAGWRPPARLDTAATFGQGGASAEAFNAMVERIQAHGLDPKHTDGILNELQTLRTNRLQRATLLALLTRELKEAGLLTKPIRQQLDALAGDVAQPRARGEYGKNHTENATLYLERYYSGGGLVRSDQTWYAYTGKAWVELADDDVKASLSADMASSLPQHSNIAGTYNVLCSLCHVAGRRINEISHRLILFQNGVLDLTSGKLLPHDAKYFTTNILPYDYNPGVPHPNWSRFLGDIFEEDPERVALLQEWFGYMMSNSYRHHKMLLLLGPARSGKGTLGRVMEQLVGTQNFTGASLHAFATDAFLESLRTKTVAFSGDTERRVGRNTVDVVIERLKKISGYDAVTFSRKWKTTLSQTLPTRITIAGNHVPNLFDDSGALAGRLLVLPINVSWLDHENLYLYDAILPELPGIAAWALEGLRRLNANGEFTQPAASEAERQHIAETYSPLKAFVDSVCTLNTDRSVFCRDLYNAYRAWAINEQESSLLPRRTFINAFKDATRGHGCSYGAQRIDGEIQRGFYGVTLARIEPATGEAFKPKVVK